MLYQFMQQHVFCMRTAKVEFGNREREKHQNHVLGLLICCSVSGKVLCKVHSSKLVSDY